MSGNLVVEGGRVITAEQADPRHVTVTVVDGMIDQIGPSVAGSAGPTLDADGCHVVPGFVDVQINGAFGIDLTNEPHRVPELAALLPQFGVTAFCPTVITGPGAVVPDAIGVVLAHRGGTSALDEAAARVLGLHVEGPYLAPEYHGAHPSEHIRTPSTRAVIEWIDQASASGSPSAISMVTLAPELPGALDLTDLLVAAGITVCAGHTAANAREMAAAERRGITGVTHLFNAMTPLGHREPGVVGATLSSKALIAGLIADGLHVDPITLDLAWRILGPERTALVTDSVAALGLPDGSFRLGDVAVDVRNGAARTTSGSLAGSVLSMDQAVRNLIAYTGCSLADASHAASTTPARLVGATHLGRIEPQRPADLVLLDESLDVAATVIGGIVSYDPQHRFAE